MQARGVGPRVGRQLISAFGSIEALWSASVSGLEKHEEVSAKLAKSLQSIDQKSVEAVFQS